MFLGDLDLAAIAARYLLPSPFRIWKNLTNAPVKGVPIILIVPSKTSIMKH